VSVQKTDFAAVLAADKCYQRQILQPIMAAAKSSIFFTLRTFFAATKLLFSCSEPSG
jgi:hypothetical protein